MNKRLALWVCMAIIMAMLTPFVAPVLAAPPQAPLKAECVKIARPMYYPNVKGHVFALYVPGTENNQGYFKFKNYKTGAWETAKWDSWRLEGGGILFGVSKSWALWKYQTQGFWWKNTTWYYYHSC